MKNIEKTKWITWQYKFLIPLFIIVGVIIFIIAFMGMQTLTGLGELNEPVLYLFSTHRDPTINSIMQIITSVASPSFFLVGVSLGSLVWVYKKREVWRPLVMVLAVGASASLSTLVKLITQNDRPLNTDMVPPFETGYSFPSGHTLGTFVLLLVTGYLFYSRYTAKDRNFWLITWMITTISGTSMVALSRLYLGYHWLTDTVASIGLGLIIFGIVIFIDKFLTRKQR